MKMRRQEEGKRLEKQSLSIIEKKLGKRHPRYADELIMLGRILK